MTATGPGVVNFGVEVVLVAEEGLVVREVAIGLFAAEVDDDDFDVDGVIAWLVVVGAMVVPVRLESPGEVDVVVA